MCPCCPPAISALFCLYVQSGCSKGSVAGALTFFPPDPPLYKFERYDKSGNRLPEDASADPDAVVEENPPSGLEDELELVEVTTPSGGGSLESPRDEEKQQQQPVVLPQEEEKEQSPAQQLAQRAKMLRERAHQRNLKDAHDAANGITYKLELDPRLPRPSLQDCTMECIKIPSRRGVHLAAMVSRCASQTSHTKTIVYSHGNATDIGAMFSLQTILAQSLQCNVVSYDYSGYGESGGVPTEHNTYTDIQSVYDYTLDNVCDGDASNLILYGQSVGSGPSCYLAHKQKEALGGMILHSPFKSGMRVLTPSRLLACLDIYPNINRIKYVKCPVMIIHGKMDEEVRFHHGQDLYNAIPSQYKRDPWWVSDRGHNDITEGPGKMTEYLRRLRQFLDSL